MHLPASKPKSGISCLGYFCGTTYWANLLHLISAGVHGGAEELPQGFVQWSLYLPIYLLELWYLWVNVYVARRV